MQKAKFLLVLLFVCGISQADSKAFHTQIIPFKEKSDFNGALPLIKKAAEKGIAEAQFYYGTYYRQGLVVQQNDSLAFLWISKAADQGFANAQMALAEIYMEGKIKKQDFSKAMELIQICAKAGDANCMWNLSSFYEMGMDVKQDSDSMLYWQVAVAKLDSTMVEQGDMSIVAQARINIAEWYREGYKGIQKDLVKSYAWYLIYNEDKKFILRPEENKNTQEKHITAIKQLEEVITGKDHQEAIAIAEKILQRKLNNLGRLYQVE